MYDFSTQSITVVSSPVISNAQLQALQRRMASLRTAELITDKEMHSFGDTLTEFLELKGGVINGLVTHEMVYDSEPERWKEGGE